MGIYESVLLCIKVVAQQIALQCIPNKRHHEGTTLYALPSPINNYTSKRAAVLTQNVTTMYAISWKMYFRCFKKYQKWQNLNLMWKSFRFWKIIQFCIIPNKTVYFKQLHALKSPQKFRTTSSANFLGSWHISGLKLKSYYEIWTFWLTFGLKMIQFYSWYFRSTTSVFGTWPCAAPVPWLWWCKPNETCTTLSKYMDTSWFE